MRPLIGISAWYTTRDVGEGLGLAKLNASYIDSIYAAGGSAVILAPNNRLDPIESARELLARVDGLLLSGGDDFDPARYGQTPHAKTEQMHPLRQPFELALFAEADRLGLPIFGICMGAQTFALARGGSLHQHVADVNGDSIQHANAWAADPPMHEVAVAAGSRLRQIVGADRIQVNSRHHQAVSEPGEHLKVTATAVDGTIEALEDDRPDRWLLAVQWHPESISARSEHLALFAALVEQSRRFGHVSEGREPRRHEEHEEK